MSMPVAATATRPREIAAAVAARHAAGESQRSIAAALGVSRHTVAVALAHAGPGRASARVAEVVRLTLDGWTAERIAARLMVNNRTVDGDRQIARAAGDLPADCRSLVDRDSMSAADWDRVAEVARLTRAGWSAARIAERLAVSTRTVERDRSRGAHETAAPPPTESHVLAAPASSDTSLDWRHRAACREADPELFFPEGTTGPAERQVEEAKAVCRRCPVVSDCLTWALETGQDSGVWGATSEGERRALKRRQTRSRAGAA